MRGTSSDKVGILSSPSRGAGFNELYGPRVQHCNRLQQRSAKPAHEASNAQLVGMPAAAGCTYFDPFAILNYILKAVLPGL
jgi:hypothetical protein